MRATTAVLMTLCLAATAEATEKEFSLDFRGKGFDFARLQLLGEGAERHVRLESGGLHIVLPDNQKLPVLGATPRFRVRGDFEITAEFEILKLGKPTAGNGSGATLYVIADSNGKEAGSIGRVSRVREGDVFFAMHGATPSDGQRKYETRCAPSQARVGRLRLVRTGSVLRCLYAAGKSSEFEELMETPFSRADLVQVRLGADGGGTACEVDVVWKQVSIRAEGLPSANETGSGTSWYVGGVLVFGLAAGAWWVWRRYFHE